MCILKKLILFLIIFNFHEKSIPFPSIHERKDIERKDIEGKNILPTSYLNP